MGTCGFHCWNNEERKVDVGYDLKEQFWGKGYMREAMEELIKFALDEMHIKEFRYPNETIEDEYLLGKATAEMHNLLTISISAHLM